MFRKVVYNGFHTVEQIEVKMKGKKRVIERLGIKNAVAAIITDIEGKVGLVKQYRPCVEEVLYEIPAGLLDKEGLTAVEILTEELEEECEINRDKIAYFSEKPLQTYYMLSGSSNAEISIYRVKLSSKEITKNVSDVDVESVEWMTFLEFENLVKEGKIKDSKTVLAYSYLKNE